jgi:quercetin dioxygenase-like cupin family protein
MAKSGDVIENPVSKHRIKFLETTAETNGERLKMEYTIEAGGMATPWHIHLHQDEYFEVLFGKLGLYLDNRKSQIILDVGETAQALHPIAHEFFNPSDAEPVTFIFEARNPGNFETFLETYAGLARDGKVKPSGLTSNLLQSFVILEIVDTYFPTPVILAYVQMAFLKIGALIGRLFGFKSRYEKYSG